MLRISNALVAEGLASETEIQEILGGLNEAAGDCETLMSLPRIFQVWGKHDIGGRGARSS